MLPIRYSFSPADISTNGFADNVSGSNFNLTANNATDSLAHIITVTNNSLNDYSGINLIFTGTDVDGFALTETISGPGISGTISTVNYFATLTSVVPSESIGSDTFSIGWADQFISPTIALNYRGGITSPTTVISGTINYSIQQTSNNIQTLDRSSINWSNNSNGSLVNVTTNQNNTNYISGIIGIRLVVNSYSSGATIKLTITQRNM